MVIASAQASTANAPIDSIVALVDEDVILRSELDMAVAGILERVRASGETMPPMNLLESQVLERLIIRELQIQRAMQTGIRVSDSDIDQAMVALAQQNNMTVQQLRQVIGEFLLLRIEQLRKLMKCDHPGRNQCRPF